MIHRRTLIILIIFVLLGGFFYAYDKVYQERKEKAKEKTQLFFPLKKDEITSVKLIKQGYNIVFEKQKDNSWLMLEPGRYIPSEDEVDGFLDQITGLSQKEVIEEETGNLSDFGLEKPQSELIVSSPGSHYSVSFGDRTPTDKNYYAQRSGSRQVVLSPDYIGYYLDKAPDAFRLTSLLNMDTAKAAQIAIKYPGKEIELKKTGKKWEILKPFMRNADPQVVGDYLWNLHNPVLKDFLPSASAGDKYMLEVTVWEEGKAEPEVLRIIKLSKDGANYIGWRKTLDEKFLIPRDKGDKLFSGEDDFIDKHVFTYDQNNVDQIEISIPDAELSAVRIKKKDKSTWNVTVPKDSPPDKAYAVDNILGRWSRMKYAEDLGKVTDSKKLEEMGLIPGKYRLVFKDKKGNVLEEAAVGFRAPEGKGFYAKVKGRDDVCLIDEKDIYDAAGEINFLKPEPAPNKKK
ncbi:MAG: DUF4340 domain-containing protein [Chloroflexi bacterium]|nr:DUF4340 domain-containing protein [Chloroflexota bacterium]